MKPPTCPLCKSPYSVEFKGHGDGKPGRHPMLLRCGHAFCETCLQKCTCTEPDHAVQCPTCKLPTKQGSGISTLSAINQDIYMVGLIWSRRLELERQSCKILGKPSMKGNKKAAAPSQQAATVCSECQVNNATCRCLKCDCSLCKSCFDKIHQSSNILRKHQSVPLQGPDYERLMQLKKTRSLMCSSHDQCLIEYFCKEDNQPICSRCVIMGDHKEHAIQTMEEKNKEYLSEMDAAMLTAQEVVWRLEKSEKLISQNMPTCHVDAKDAVEKVKLHFQQLHSLLQAREEQLLDRIQEISVNSVKLYQDTKEHLQQERLSLEIALKDAAHTKQKSIYAIADADLVLERLKAASELACVVTLNGESVAEPVKFSLDSSLKDVICSYGDVSCEKQDKILTLSVPGPDAEVPPPDALRTFSVSDTDTQSGATDTESNTDSASVIIEEDRMETLSTDEARTTAAETIRKEETTETVKSGRHFEAGQVEDIKVTHISTPADVYVQLVSQAGELYTLQRNMNQMCRQPQAKRVPSERLAPGTMVFAQFLLDKSWYRAVITEVLEPKGGKGTPSYKVFFLDFGNSEVVTVQRMRAMKKTFESQPAFAYKCSLHDIQPANKAKGWTPKAVDIVLQMTRDGPLSMTVMNSDNSRLEVDIRRLETQQRCMDYGPESLRESLIFMGLAVSTSCPPQLTAATSRMSRDLVSAPRLPEGNISYIGVTCVHNPSLFYGQVMTDNWVNYLRHMTMSMQDTYSEENRHKYAVYCPKKDMLCVAKYHEDDNWYRGRVTGLPGQGKVEVQFVDYGNTETIDCADICKILTNNLKCPPQALTCSLADVKPIDGDQWSEKAETWFKSRLAQQICQVRVTGQSQKPNSLMGVVYALDPAHKNVYCVNTEMVRQGFATSTGKWSVQESFEGITIRAVDERAPENDSVLSSLTSSTNFSSPTSTRLSSSSEYAMPREDSPSSTKQKRSRRGRRGQSSSPGSSASNSSLSSANSPILVSQDTSTSKSGGMQNEAEATATSSSDGPAEVIISSYTSPSNFHIQLQENQKSLLKLMTELQNYETTQLRDDPWKVGAFCVAKYTKDERWYRANITRQVNSDSYEVILVDYGHVDVIAANQLRQLKKAHGMECLAERCHLAKVMPAGTWDISNWSVTATTFMGDQIRAKRLYVKLEGDSLPDLGLPVDILVEHIIPETALEPPRHEYTSLVSLIQDKGLAVPISSDSDSVTFSPPKSSLAKVLTTTSDCTVSEGTPVDRDGVLSDKLKKEEVVATEPVIQPGYTIPPHPPPASSTLSVLPVYVDKEAVIYAHDFSEDAACADLMKEVMQCSQMAPKGELQVEAGVVCLAFCREDDTWYRAKVLVVTGKSVKVRYVDYGNTESLDKSQLRLISPELCARPQMAYEFVLHNLKPSTVDGSWPSSIQTYLLRQLVNVQCTALVKGDMQQCPLGVDMVPVSGESISKVLLEKGSAVLGNEMEEHYQRSADIGDILRHSNPYFPLKPGAAGEVFHGLVTHIELPNLVYIQRCAAPPDDVLPEDITQFLQMMDELNGPGVMGVDLKDVPGAGEMCSAQYTFDDRWYRGLIVNTYPEDTSALVFYVDYGNSEILLLDRLRSLPQNFQDTPAQALRAYLNVDLPEGTKCWTRNIHSAMAATIFHRHVVFIKHTDPLMVELYSEDANMLGAASLSYQSLLDQNVISLPSAIKAVNAAENLVIVETTHTETDELSSPYTEDTDDSSSTAEESPQQS